MLKEIETHVTYICNDILTPLSKMDDKDIPQGLKTDVEKLARSDDDIPSSFTDL